MQKNKQQFTFNKNPQDVTIDCQSCAVVLLPTPPLQIVEVETLAGRTRVYHGYSPHVASTRDEPVWQPPDT